LVLVQCHQNTGLVSSVEPLLWATRSSRTRHWRLPHSSGGALCPS
jgi:hypothetical protein